MVGYYSYTFWIKVALCFLLDRFVSIFSLFHASDILNLERISKWNINRLIDRYAAC